MLIIDETFQIIEMEVKSITDISDEVIRKFIMIYLSSNDVFHFGMTGDTRFKQLAEDVMKHRGE